MTQQVEFQGQRFEFPAQATTEQIQKTLGQWRQDQPTVSGLSTPDKSAGLRTEDTSYAPTESYFENPEDRLQVLQSLNTKQSEFAELIAEVETGSQPNRSIRTKVKPTGGNAGSSAYGTYQITHGLLSGWVEQGKFSGQEQAAAQELLRRQEISLAIGGRDRVKYEAGGAKHAQGKAWATAYGYETVEEFLDDFDYGGTLGLGNDAQFQVLYESFARKMLNQHLRDANGDVLKAAAVWHGGPKGAGKTTKQYVEKVRRLMDERSN
jgi:hypothetical protein